MSDIEHADILEILARQQMTTGTSEMTFGNIAAQLGGSFRSSQLKNSLNALRQRGLVLLHMRKNSSQNQGARATSFVYSLNSPFLLQKAVELKGQKALPSARDNSSGSGNGKDGSVTLSAVEQLFSITPVATQIFKLYEIEDSRNWLRLASISSEWHDLCRKGEHLDLLHFELRGRPGSDDGTLLQLVSSLPLSRHLDFSLFKNLTDRSLQISSSLSYLRSLNISRISFPNQKITEQGLQTTLSAMTSLENLNVSHWKSRSAVTFPRIIPSLSSLPKLKSLDVSNSSRVNDGTLQEISQLSRLENLNLSNCREITDSGIQALAPLSNLKTLDLTLSHFTCRGLAAVLSQLSNLESLVLADSSVYGLHETQWHHALRLLLTHPKMRSLDLRSVLITDQDLQELSASLPNLPPGKRQSDLSELILEDNPDITEQGLSVLTAVFPKLRSLNLNRCKSIRDYEPLSSLKELVNLDLSKARINDRHLQLLCPLFSQLKSLNLRKCKEITPVGVKAALKAATSRLENLNLSTTNVTDETLTAVLPGKLSGLKNLDLAFCEKVTAKGLEKILETVFSPSSSLRLRGLNLSGCRVTDRTLHIIKNSKASSCLSRLDLRSCNDITDKGLQQMLSAMSDLRDLDIANCLNLTKTASLNAVANSPSRLFLRVVGIW